MSQKISIRVSSDMIAAINERVDAGMYASTDDVMTAALRALDREETILDRIVEARIREALGEPSSGIPAQDVFDRIERLHAESLKTLD